MKLDNVLVLGGSGFVGRHLVAALAANGIRVTVPSRHRERAKHLLPLPTVDVVETDIMAPGALEALAGGRQAVINLVGILHGDFERVHAELPRRVVAACRARGVGRLLHMSALGASPGAPSEYLRTKAAGEQAALAATDLAVTAFRPSVIFGPEDAFLNTFAALARTFPVLPIACPQARFQPVYVADVAQAMCRALDDLSTHGKTYELCGPRQYTLKELVELVCEMTGRHRAVIGLSDRLSYWQAFVMERLPGKLITRDNLRSMQVPNVCAGVFPFGIRPEALEAAAPAYLAPAGPRERYPRLRWRARR
ncbi:MAG TPA: complex I NDUFA9 subunit family protein [Burkholderiales bacterium]|nr:complex I NDUFA9 subunit family protein [Burkholderiales bacterium]